MKTINTAGYHDKNIGSFLDFMKIVNTAATVSIGQKASEMSRSTEQLRGDVQQLGSVINDLNKGVSEICRGMTFIAYGFSELGVGFPRLRLHPGSASNILSLNGIQV